MKSSSSLFQQISIQTGLVLFIFGLCSCEDTLYQAGRPGSVYSGSSTSPDYRSAYQSGYNEGYNQTYRQGFRDGASGNQFQGYSELNSGSGPYSRGRYEGSRAGYSQGYRDGRSQLLRGPYYGPGQNRPAPGGYPPGRPGSAENPYQGIPYQPGYPSAPY
jgi:hypothetical protein